MDAIHLGGGGNFKNSTIQGDCHIDGPLNAEGCEFLGEISISSPDVHFKKCKISSILVREAKNPADQQKLVLEDETKVRGDVVFQSGKGVVILKGSSKVLGVVKGGTIQEQ